MEQLNTVLSEQREEDQTAAVAAYEKKKSGSPLLDKVRQKYGTFGLISLIFGSLLALLFYKAGIGLNIMLFTAAIIILMTVIMGRLSVPLKKATRYYYAGAFLLGLSSVLTSSPILQFLNVTGILLLFDLSLLHQFNDDRKWDFIKHFLRMIGLAFQSIAAIAMPFIDCVNFMKSTRLFKNDKVRNIFLGIVISVPFLWVIVALLANADLLFGRLTGKVFSIIFSTDIIAVAFIVIAGFLICYCVICASVVKAGSEEEHSFKKADASIAATFMTILCPVYAVFCTLQIIYLFAGGLLTLPEKYTFAEYARRGFFELLAVAVINVALMVLTRSFFKENKVLRFSITFMTLCTYIMIASAAYRMLLYIGAYHLTFLRVLVLLALFVIALVLAGVIISQYKQSFPLFGYCVAVVSICYIAFSFSKPDCYIASYLIDHTDKLDAEDISYLTQELSLDAAPEVVVLLADRSRWTMELLHAADSYNRGIYQSADQTDNYYIDKYLNRIERSKPDSDIRDFNYSCYLAVSSADKYPLE